MIKRMLLIAGATLAAAAFVVPAALADTTEVGAALCGDGGHVSVPAGTEVVVRQGISFRRYGTGVEYLGSAQTTLISVNDGTPVDVSDRFEPLVFQSVTTDLGAVVWVWRSRVLYPTGISLAPGESLTFHFLQTLSRPVPDWVFDDTGQWTFQFDGPGVFEDVTCTVTGL